MSTIHKIIINGSEYVLADPGAVAFDESQTLSEEEKVQARENIGAAGGALVVTIRDGRPSDPAHSIIEHLENGGNAVLLYKDEYFALDHYYPDAESYGGVVSFVRNNCEEGITTQVDIYNDGTFDEYVHCVGDLVPTKVSQLENDSGYLTGYTETDPTVPSWAKASSKPAYTKSEVGLGNVDNVKQYSASNPPPYPVTKVNGKTGAVTLSASDVSAVPTSSALTVTGVDANGATHTWTMYGVKN